MKTHEVLLSLAGISSSELYPSIRPEGRTGRGAAELFGVEPKSEIAAANQNRQEQSLLPCVRSPKENALGRHDLRSRNPTQVRGCQHRTID